MEHIPEIIKAMAEWGVSPLNLILIAMMYFIGAKNGIFPPLWKEEKKENVPEWAQHLLQNFNHSTTDFHLQTHQKLDTLIEKEEEEAKERQEIRDNTRDIKTKLAEFDRYGVKVRGLVKKS